jgi:hypothetical protein
LGELGNDEGREPVGIDGLTGGDRRRLRRVWWAVTAPVVVVYIWILTDHSWNLLGGGQYFDDFYDAQARSLLHGRWDVAPEVAGIEGFVVDGRTYIYFGPLPALLRMPLFLVTDRFDGRLTALSMIVGFLLFAAASFRLATALRAFVRGQDPVTRRELAGTALLALAVLTGTPFWLSSLTVVHHEAVLWGAATTIAAFDALARWVLDPRPARLATASAWVAAALLSRQTLGLGALAALALLVALALADRVRARLPIGAASDAGAIGAASDAGAIGAVAPPVRSRARRRRAALADAPGASLAGWMLVAAVLAPAVLSAIPNLARFDKVFGVPVESQVYSLNNSGRQEFLAANRGSFFGLQFVPTTTLQYFRPDAFDIRPDLPWIDFPRTTPKVIGDVSFDDVTFSSSVTATMPLLTALAVVGVGVLARGVRRRRPEAWVVVLALGAVVGAGGVLGIGHVANRYLTDIYPLVLILALIGFHARAPRLVELRPRWRRLITLTAVGAVTFGMLATVAMALEYRHERGPGLGQADRTEWVRARATAPLSSPNVTELDEGAPLPAVAFDGLHAVVGDCDGVYVRVGGGWVPAERGPGVDVFDITVDLDALDRLDDDATRAPLVTMGSGYGAVVVAVTRTSDDEVRVDVWDGPNRGWRTGAAQPLTGEVTIHVEGDRRTAPNAITSGDVYLYSEHVSAPRSGGYRIGAAPEIPGVAARYPGAITLDEPDRSICRALTE